jgi:hypothetical protein
MFAEWLTPAASRGRLGPAVEITVDTLGDVAAYSAAHSPQAGDAIFLRFCNRQNLTELDLEAPRMLVDRIKEKLAWRPSRSFVVAGLISATALIVFVSFSSLISDFLKVAINYLSNGAVGTAIIIAVGVVPILEVTSYARTRSKPVPSFGVIPLIFLIVYIFILPVAVDTSSNYYFFALLGVPILVFAQPANPPMQITVPSARGPRGIGGFWGSVLFLLGLSLVIMSQDNLFKFVVTCMMCAGGIAAIYSYWNYYARITSAFSYSVAAAIWGFALYIDVVELIQLTFNINPRSGGSREIIYNVFVLSLCTVH